jgi:hypothetical protein
MGWSRVGAVGALAGWALLLAPVFADEATLKDGRRVRGALRLEKPGRLLFAPADRGAAVGLPNLSRARFEAPAPLPFRVSGGRRLRLRDGQQLTGAFLGLQKQSLVLRTAWADRVEVPRAAVASLGQLPGWIALVEDDLSAVPKGWTVSGKPVAAAKGVELRAPGQALTYPLAAPLAAGRVGVNFEANGAGGGRWLFEATFEGKSGARALRVTLAGAGGHYEVDAGGLEGTTVRVARTPGPHRLVVRFGPGSLSVTCDDDVLWHNLARGPGGPLRRVSLRCVEGTAAVKGAVTCAAFSLERAVDEPPRPPGDDSQDELWLASGDQLFGRVLRADRQAVTLEGRFGTRAFAWAELRGWCPRREAAPAKSPEGAVRVGLRSGLDAEEDVLDGVVTALDDKFLTLRHAFLGELRLDRRHVASLRPR